MPAIIRPDSQHGGLDEVERWYRSEKDATLAKKLNVIRLLMKGQKVREVAEALGVCVATIRNWRARWNREGKDGLKSQYKGSKSRITEDIRLEIMDIIEVKQEIGGRTVTGKFIHGRIKKNTT